MPRMIRIAPLLFVLGIVACKKNDLAVPDAAPLPAEGAGLSERDVKRVVREAKPAMEKCYDEAVATKPEFRGAVTLVFAVEPDGTVNKKRAGLGGDVGGDSFAKCVLDIVVGLRFPSTTAPTDVQMPLDLGKHADAGAIGDAGATKADAKAD